MAWAMRGEKSFSWPMSPGMCRHPGGVQAVLVAVLGGDNAVGGHKDGALEGLEFLLLLPPGVAVVADEVGVFAKSGIGVGREHF